MLYSEEFHELGFDLTKLPTLFTLGLDGGTSTTSCGSSCTGGCSGSCYRCKSGNKND